MGRRISSIVSTVGFVVLFCSVFTAAAAAQDAREHFKRGAAEYQQGDYSAAIAEWLRAYELDPRPRLQYNLSQAYERLGQLEKAVQALQAYIKGTPADDVQMGTARVRLAALRERLGKTAIKIVGGEEGATILIDGEDWGRTPRRDPIRVSPGTHEVEVTKPGYTAFRSSAVVAGGQQIELQVKMEPAEGADETSEAISSDEAIAQATGDGDEAIGETIWPWVLIGGGGAAVLGGSVLGLSALGKADDAVAAGSSDEADSARGLALGADIMIGLGVVAAGAGVALLLLFPGEQKAQDAASDQAIRIAPQLGASGAGVQAAGLF